MATRLLTASQAAHALQLQEHTLWQLVNAGAIPHTTVQTSTNFVVRFCPATLTDWLGTGALFHGKAEEKYVTDLRRTLARAHPAAIATLKTIDDATIPPRTPKGYSLSKVHNLRLGFTYYVRYMEDGRLVPSRWATGTNSLDLAQRFATENRVRLLEAYHARKRQKESTADVCALMTAYYAEGSKYLVVDTQRGKALSEPSRRVRYTTVVNRLVPYLKTQHVRSLSDIDTAFLARYQNHLLAQGIKPQTVNNNLSYISRVFEHLTLIGLVKTNPFRDLHQVRPIIDAPRGCMEVGHVRGVFDTAWERDIYRLLCALIYTTGMRNSEIARIRLADIVQIQDCRFINIRQSKTANGVRLVPLHPAVHEMLVEHLAGDARVGDLIHKQMYTPANEALGLRMGYDKERLAAEHITFYSGRHFFKTLMNSEDLGDIEEVFMGHHVSQDVAQRYNHRDKQGLDRLVKKAREVLAVLDRRVFTSRRADPPPSPPASV